MHHDGAATIHILPQSGEVKEVREELIAKTKKIAELQALLDARKLEMQAEVDQLYARDYNQAEENRRLNHENNNIIMTNAEQKSTLDAAHVVGDLLQCIFFHLGFVYLCDGRQEVFVVSHFSPAFVAGN